VRNAAWVNWQCYANRWFRKEVVAAHDASELRGFAVAVTENWRGLRILDCVDLWYDFADGRVAATLFRGLADLAAVRNCDAVQVSHFNDSVGRHLRGLGLLSLVREPIVGYWRAPGPEFDAASTENTYITLIDGDRYL
jgi:hypothetical protein